MTDHGRTKRVPPGLALLLVVFLFGALLVPVPGLGLRSVRVSAQGPPQPDVPDNVRAATSFGFPSSA